MNHQVIKIKHINSRTRANQLTSNEFWQLFIWNHDYITNPPKTYTLQLKQNQNHHLWSQKIHIYEKTNNIIYWILAWRMNWSTKMRKIYPWAASEEIVGAGDGCGRLPVADERKAKIVMASGCVVSRDGFGLGHRIWGFLPLCCVCVHCGNTNMSFRDFGN